MSQPVQRAVWLAGPPGFAALYQAELPQKDGLCGPFWLSLALRAAGPAATDGTELGQDQVAVAAGSQLAEGDPARWLPPGETSRADYHIELAVVGEDVSGTSVAGLVRAADSLGDGWLTAVPVAGPWTEPAVAALFEAAAVDPSALLLANVQTGVFIGAHASFRELFEAAYGDAAALPDPDWDVGHFVNPMLYLEAPRAALVLVRDTYPSLGSGGYHWQTASSLAAALARNDGREGGVLVLCSPPARPAIESGAERAGLRVEMWDNGTPS